MFSAFDPLKSVTSLSLIESGMMRPSRRSPGTFENEPTVSSFNYCFDEGLQTAGFVYIHF